MIDRPPRFTLPFALTCLAASACSTQEVGPDEPFVIASFEKRPGTAYLVVGILPRVARFEELGAYSPDPTTYHVFLDGRLVVGETDLGIYPFVVHESSTSAYHYIETGRHHFTVAAPERAPISEIDGELLDGGKTCVFLFGPPDARRGIVTSVPRAASAGNQHVNLVNLMGSGQTIEVVSCSGRSTCTPISQALALGDVFDADVPAVVPDDCSLVAVPSDPCSTSLRADGVGIAYRLVPSASRPNPPLLPLRRLWDSSSQSDPAAAVYAGSPAFISDEGELLLEF